MSVQELSIYYEGEYYKGGKMDIKELAPSLLAFGEIINETNKIINDSKTEVQTYITATENKCFKCTISLEASNVLQSVKSFWCKRHIKNIQELLELLGFIGIGVAGGVIVSYVAYKKIEQGKKVKKHTILQDGNAQLTLEDETTLTVTFNLFTLIKASWQKKWSIKKNFDKHLSSAKSDIGYTIDNNDKNVTTISEHDKRILLLPDKNLEKLQDKQDPIKTNLTIRQPDYHGDTKWTFLYAGKTIKPDYNDFIKAKLQEIRKDVKYHSKLPVEMIITYDKDENEEAISGTEQYIILQITGDLIQENNQETIL